MCINGEKYHPHKSKHTYLPLKRIITRGIIASEIWKGKYAKIWKGYPIILLCSIPPLSLNIRTAQHHPYQMIAPLYSHGFPEIQQIVKKGYLHFLVQRFFTLSCAWKSKPPFNINPTAPPITLPLALERSTIMINTPLTMCATDSSLFSQLLSSATQQLDAVFTSMSFPPYGKWPLPSVIYNDTIWLHSYIHHNNN